MKAFIIEATPDSPSQQSVLVNLLCNAESDTEFLVSLPLVCGVYPSVAVTDLFHPPYPHMAARR